MLLTCELKRLRRLKSALLAQYRCEKTLANLPDQLEPRIEACEELAALKLAEENLETQKKIDVDDKKKRVRRATWLAGIISFVVFAAIALLLSLTVLPAVLVVVGGTVVPTLIAHLIAKSTINKKPAKNADEIAACEEELAYAIVAFESAKVIIEEHLKAEIAYYENILSLLKTTIEISTVVPPADKNYNTVCQIIWCLEHKYAFSIRGARQWVTLANLRKQVRANLNESTPAPQQEEEITPDEAEDINTFEELLKNAEFEE